MAHLPSSLCGLFLLLLAAFLAPVQAAGRSVPSDVPVNDGFYNAYILPLTYATPDFILDELNLYVRPDTGNSTLKRREILCNGVKIEGIESIGPERYDNSLVIFATHNGFKAMKALIKSMDTPFAVKAALRGRFFPRLRVKVTFLGGPIPTQLVKMGNATLRSGKKVPMYLQPWGQNFPVLLRVTNSSAVLQSFVTFGCTWDQNWQVRAVGHHRRDEVRFGPGSSYAANPLLTITLKPGGCYQRQTVVSIRAMDRPHRVHFQVGFVRNPGVSAPFSSQPNRIFWSNKVAVSVTNAYGN